MLLTHHTDTLNTYLVDANLRMAKLIEDFVRLNDQRKDDSGLYTSWQQCQTLDYDNVSMALLQCECVTR